MVFVCDLCNFTAPNNSRYQRHLSTQKHSKNASNHARLMKNVQEVQLEEKNDENMVQNVLASLLEENIDQVETVQEGIMDEEEEIVQEGIMDEEEEIVQEGIMEEEETVENEDNGLFIEPIFLDRNILNTVHRMNEPFTTHSSVVYILALLFRLYNFFVPLPSKREDSIISVQE